MKKKYYKSLVAAAIVASFTQSALADTIGPLTAIQDTWTSGSGAGTGVSYGVEGETGSDVLRLDTGKNQAFVQFSVNIPAGHVVEKATLTLTAKDNLSKKGGVPAPIPETFIKPIPNATWDEATLTDLTDDDLLAAAGEIIATATNIAIGSATDFDVTSAITGNGNFTFLVNIENSTVRNTKYHSSQAVDEAVHPKLTITTKAGAVEPAGDTIAPIFSADIPAIEIDATGSKTDISTLLNISAIDETDGELPATVVGDSSLISGAHTVTLQATDAAGNLANKEVSVNITPLIIITPPENLALPSGETASATLSLSGPAVSYPATIDYTITGDAANNSSDTLIFTAENYTIAQVVDITLKADAQGGQSAVLALAATSNVQANEENITVTTFDGNLAPNLILTLSQADTNIATITAGNADSIPYIDATKGDVTVTLDIADFNNDDTHTTSWADSSEALGSANNSFTFSPAELSGDFILKVSSTEDNTTEKYSASLSTTIRIITTGLPELVAEVDTDEDGISDIEEGFNDSDGDGIVDYLDDNSDTTQLPLSSEQKPLQTLEGLTLSLGSIASAKGISADSAVITLQDLADNVAADSADTSDTGFAAIDGASLFNFTLNGVTEGESAPIVYPLPSDVVITTETEYRKYTAKNGWVKFVSDSDNAIASAVKDETGNCPAPNSELYLEGLTAGDSCIQLTIQDGGIYDADGEANGSIEDPGVLAESYTVIEWSTDNIALPDTIVNEGSSITLTEELADYLTDIDLTMLTFTVGDDASWLTVDEAGLLSADLSSLASGDYSTTVSFTGSKAQTGTTRVSLKVAYNSAPELAAVELAAAAKNVAYSASIADAITDAESDAITIEKVAGPYWLKVSETGQLSGTPSVANIGDNNITLKLTDTKGASREVGFNVPVEDSEVSASDGGSFSAMLLSLLGLLSLRRRKTSK